MLRLIDAGVGEPVFKFRRRRTHGEHLDMDIRPRPASSATPVRLPTGMTARCWDTEPTFFITFSDTSICS